MTDEEIIALFFERSEQAIVEIEKKHGGAVRQVAAHILGDRQDAEECVSDTWMAAWNGIPPSRPAPLRTYLCKVARNLALKKHRSNTAEKRNTQYDLALEELSEYIPDGGSVEGEYDARELAEAINRFLAALSYEERFLFTRRYWYADSLPEIAQMTGLSYSAVSVRLHRIREKLKNHLIKEELLV